jgi:hypothetical protein
MAVSCICIRCMRYRYGWILPGSPHIWFTASGTGAEGAAVPGRKHDCRLTVDGTGAGATVPKWVVGVRRLPFRGGGGVP